MSRKRFDPAALRPGRRQLLLYGLAVSALLHLFLLAAFETDGRGPYDFSIASSIAARLERPADHGGISAEAEMSAKRDETALPRAIAPAGETLRSDVAAVAAEETSPSTAGRRASLSGAANIGQYRIALMSVARSNSSPVRAQPGLQGRVDVRIEFDALGGLTQIGIARSSGLELLDREAVNVLRQAAEQAPPPRELHGRSVAIEIPVLFEPGPAPDAASSPR